MIALATLALLASATDLSRVFAANESRSYSVHSRLQTETRGMGVRTWMPATHAFEYGFTIRVTDLLPDGVAQVRYQRPYMIVVEERFGSDEPERRVEKTDLDFELRLSSSNEILQSKALNASKKAGWMGDHGAFAQPQVTDFIGELYRLAAFAGSLDNALDLLPKLPFEAVQQGETWRRTVGYQPQRLSTGKSAVQRLDYVYDYKGIIEVEGFKVHRIHATMKLDTDAAEWVNQWVEGGIKATGLAKLPMRLETAIDLDLDLATRATLRANATSSGFVAIYTPDSTEPALEVKLKGRSSLAPTK